MKRSWLVSLQAARAAAGERIQCLIIAHRSAYSDRHPSCSRCLLRANVAHIHSLAMLTNS